MITVNLSVLLAQRGMSVQDFAQAVDITAANISILKNGHAKAIRFSTLDKICQVLECQPGDILSYTPQGKNPS
ncbi:helix-turn-helix domain-containing protein [uncultured Mobiluncus sp.]|uniref:helix-turn-helix domain-containing protein n=1 Tax=uncultured Mobiluncus sp. TaxID=293425 RepID=UPI0027D9B904|nr:helix-turn-helix domain-containing protein [uncultured Mobiluncus sp.]